jgi:hypothetical protein
MLEDIVARQLGNLLLENAKLSSQIADLQKALAAATAKSEAPVAPGNDNIEATATKAVNGASA